MCRSFVIWQKQCYWSSKERCQIELFSADKRTLETLAADNICIYENQSSLFLNKKFNSNVIRIMLKKAFIKRYIPMISVLNLFFFH